jgi:hypothetical protein
MVSETEFRITCTRVIFTRIMSCRRINWRPTWSCAVLNNKLIKLYNLFLPHIREACISDVMVEVPMFEVAVNEVMLKI